MENQLLCLDATPKFLNLFDFSVAPQLLFYSYIPIIIILIFTSFGIYLKDKHSNQNKALLAVGLSFSVWILNMIIQWIGVDANLVYFSWRITAVIEIMIPISTIYLVHVFLNKGNDVRRTSKYILLSILFLVLVLTPTQYNMSGFDIESCAGVVGPLLYLVYFFELVSVFWIVYISLRKLSTAEIRNDFEEIVRLKKSLYILAGSVIFLLIFSLSNIFGEITKIYQINLIGPLGMLAFISLLAFSIVKFKTFNIKLFATQALVWALIVLIGSQFFFIKSVINFFLTGITFAAAIVLGQYLIKSVKIEIDQRERLEQLKLKLEKSNLDLGDANEKLKSLDKLKTEFVSLASHQLRSPLTAIKGYTSMLIEGDYGEINPEAKGTVERIMESSNNLTLVVEDLLNVAKIEQGGMKYEMAKFDFGELARNEAKDLSITAQKKGLKLICTIPDDKKYFVNGDKEKLRQILVNLIDNSMKYTKEGQIEVGLNSNNNKIKLTIKDTGVGISKEVIGKLFEKFSRGDGAKMNASGSGLGLYLVKEIVEAHKGHVWVESEGVGKGSSFFVELDEVQL